MKSKRVLDLVTVQGGRALSFLARLLFFLFFERENRMGNSLTDYIKLIKKSTTNYVQKLEKDWKKPRLLFVRDQLEKYTVKYLECSRHVRILFYLFLIPSGMLMNSFSIFIRV
jgi:hypothetical protein